MKSIRISSLSLFLMNEWMKPLRRMMCSAVTWLRRKQHPIVHKNGELVESKINSPLSSQLSRQKQLQSVNDTSCRQLQQSFVPSWRQSKTWFKISTLVNRVLSAFSQQQIQSVSIFQIYFRILNRYYLLFIGQTLTFKHILVMLQCTKLSYECNVRQDQIVLILHGFRLSMEWLDLLLLSGGLCLFWFPVETISVCAISDGAAGQLGKPIRFGMTWSTS